MKVLSTTKPKQTKSAKSIVPLSVLIQLCMFTRIEDVPYKKTNNTYCHVGLYKSFSHTTLSGLDEKEKRGVWRAQKGGGHFFFQGTNLYRNHLNFFFPASIGLSS